MRKRGVGRIIYIVTSTVLKRFAHNITLYKKQDLPGLPVIISPANLAEEARVLTSQARLAGLLSEYDDLLAPAIVSFKKESERSRGKYEDHLEQVLDELETCHGSVIWDMDTLSISFRKVRAALREWSNASIALNTGNID